MKPTDFKNNSGQVIVEAAVGLSLLAFVWILAAVATYMSTNHVRCAMAARHAAWVKGSKGNPSVSMIETNFFNDFESGLVTIQQLQPNRIGNLFSGNPEADEKSALGRGPYKIQVSYGLLPGNETDQTPLALMNVQLPFMPPAAMEEFMLVDAHCQWDETGDAWSSEGGAIRGIINNLKDEIDW